MNSIKIRGFIDFVPDYQPGDPPPTGYLNWQSWADVQHKAGLRQVPCWWCGMYRYPQELAQETPVPVCRDCAPTAHPHREEETR